MPREVQYSAKKILVALPPAMIEQVDYVARVEHRNRSDLIREAIRRYLDSFRRTHGNAISATTIEGNTITLGGPGSQNIPAGS